MKNNNNYSFKSTWRIWLIKQLLKKNTNKEDLLKILSEDSDQDTKNDYEDLDDNNENKLLRNIFNLNEKSVEDVMVPRAEIIAIDKNKNIKDILLLIEKESHSRMPIFEQNLDNILGFIHIKDVIKNINVSDFNIKDILRNSSEQRGSASQSDVSDRWNEEWGFGLLDASCAVDIVLERVCTPLEEGGVIITPPPSNESDIGVIISNPIYYTIIRFHNC